MRDRVRVGLGRSRVCRVLRVNHPQTILLAIGNTAVDSLDRSTQPRVSGTNSAFRLTPTQGPRGRPISTSRTLALCVCHLCVIMGMLQWCGSWVIPPHTLWATLSPFFRFASSRDCQDVIPWYSLDRFENQHNLNQSRPRNQPSHVRSTKNVFLPPD